MNVMSNAVTWVRRAVTNPIVEYILVLLAALMPLSIAHGENVLGGPSSISVVGRADAVVTEATIRLSDIAQIESPRVQDDEAVIQLRKIGIGQSPQAGESVTIDGMKILEKLKDQGVQIDRIRYTFPRQVTVTRAFREINVKELERALMSFLDHSNRQMDVRQLIVDKPVRVPSDSNGVEVVGIRTTQPGHIGVDFKADSAAEEMRFQLRAIADEWRLVPTAVRPLRRGTVVTGSDVELSRMNGTSAGRDSVDNIGDVVGRSVTRDVGQGEIFRRSALAIPPVITSGSRVTLLFREGRLEATATGVSLEDGITGQEIKVRNESSNKVVSGKIVQEGLVAVGAH